MISTHECDYSDYRASNKFYCFFFRRSPTNDLKSFLLSLLNDKAGMSVNFSDKVPSVRGLGAMLERLVSSNYKDYSKSVKKSSSKNNCWWTPPQDWLLVEFCNNSAVHGLNFIGKPKLHLSERIFWTIAFILGVVSAVLLIYDLWDRYNDNPVIVSFQSKRVSIDSIPFPSVTLCNMNAFPKSKVKSLLKTAKGSGKYAATAKELMKYVRSVCHAQKSFAKEFNFAFVRGEDDSDTWNETIAQNNQDEMIDFLLEHTIPCEELIRFCILGEKQINCRQIFKPIITDYGKCCTFNILPLPLLFNNLHAVLRKDELSLASEINPVLGTKQRWSEEEIRVWKTWNYDKDGFIFENKSSTHPYRQMRAGLPYGLSILIDPNLDDWYCPVSDSEGFRFLLHNSLEIPNVNEFASFIPMNKEVFIEIHPQFTNADDDIRQFELKDRNCYFPEERQLKFFGPYTGGNCVNECTAIIMEKQCNCTYFYMPRSVNSNICNTNEDSKDFKCVDNTRVDILETLKKECKHCDSLCENIEYHFEMTVSSLQDSSQLWQDPDPSYFAQGPPQWAKNKMSIAHIFIGSDEIVSKLRKRMFGTADLIASFGGILGLCLGFSVLSVVEVVYFVTIRAFWKFCRRKVKRKKVFGSGTHSALHFIQGQRLSERERVITLKPNKIPLLTKQQWSYHDYRHHQ